MISLLRSWKRAYLDRKFRSSASRIAFLQDALAKNPDLKAITVESDRFLLELRNGLRFEWDPLERYSCTGQAISPDYEAFELRIIQHMLRPDDTVFDIGANFGYFSISIRNTFPDIELYSFEPVKRTFDLLERNLALNHLSVKTFRSGFSDRHGDVTFYIPAKLGSAWASMGKGVSTVLNYDLTEETCSVQRLDDFAKARNLDRLDFLKCDVEGAEKLVLEGGQETIGRFKPLLMLEIGDRWSASFGYDRVSFIDWVIDTFGYKCYGVLKNDLHPIPNGAAAEAYSEDSMYNYFFVDGSRLEQASKLEELSVANKNK